MERAAKAERTFSELPGDRHGVRVTARRADEERGADAPCLTVKFRFMAYQYYRG
jgi:hypothetical protein